MNFKKWVKSIQTAGYNGARTVYGFFSRIDYSAIETSDYELNTFLTLFNALRYVQVILQKDLGECHWFVYNVDEGMEKQWVVKSIFDNCKNYEIRKHWLESYMNIYMFSFEMSVANLCLLFFNI